MGLPNLSGYLNLFIMAARWMLWAIAGTFQTVFVVGLATGMLKFESCGDDMRPQLHQVNGSVLIMYNALNRMYGIRINKLNNIVQCTFG